MLTVVLRQTGDTTRDILRLRRIHGMITSNPGKDRFAFHVFERNRFHLLEFPNSPIEIRQELVDLLISLRGRGKCESRESNLPLIPHER